MKLLVVLRDSQILSPPCEANKGEIKRGSSITLTPVANGVERASNFLDRRSSPSVIKHKLLPRQYCPRKVFNRFLLCIWIFTLRGSFQQANGFAKFRVGRISTVG